MVHVIIITVRTVFSVYILTISLNLPTEDRITEFSSIAPKVKCKSGKALNLNVSRHIKFCIRFI